MSTDGTKSEIHILYLITHIQGSSKITYIIVHTGTVVGVTSAVLSLESLVTLTGSTGTLAATQSFKNVIFTSSMGVLYMHIS